MFVFYLQVHWAQQQHEKRRKKRDYAVPTQSISPFSQFFTAIAPQATRHGHPQYRAAPFVTSFPDPLFKEQWYLVSNILIFITKVY